MIRVRLAAFTQGPDALHQQDLQEWMRQGYSHAKHGFWEYQRPRLGRIPELEFDVAMHWDFVRWHILLRDCRNPASTRGYLVDAREAYYRHQKSCHSGDQQLAFAEACGKLDERCLSSNQPDVHSLTDKFLSLFEKIFRKSGLTDSGREIVQKLAIKKTEPVQTIEVPHYGCASPRTDCPNLSK